jgi:type I restriction enzyme, S subunit
MKPYPEYKESGIEWLGNIPEHWYTYKLKFLSSVQFSNVDKHTKEEENPVRLCNYTDVYYNDIISDKINFMNATANVTEIMKYGLRRGDVLITKDSEDWNDIAVPAYVADDFDNVLCGYHLAQIRPDEEIIHDKYLFYSFLSRGLNDQFRISANGITRYGLGKYWLDNGVFLVPTIPEQHAIAAHLDRETSRIDTLIAKKQRQIELLQEKRSALISHVVTKGLDPNVKMKDSGVEWLGKIPERWSVAPLRSLSRSGYKTFTDGDWIESPYIRDDGIRLIQTGNIGIGVYKEQGFRYIEDTTFNELRCTEVCPGDVLICRLADPVGRACPAPNLGVKMITSVDVCILKSAKIYDPRFIVYALSGEKYLTWMSAMCRGGTRDRVSRSMLGSVRIQLPSRDEQQFIADYLDAQTSSIDELANKIALSLEMLREYRTALISAAVTGKIDVREEIKDEQIRIAAEPRVEYGE